MAFNIKVGGGARRSGGHRAGLACIEFIPLQVQSSVYSLSFHPFGQEERRKAKQKKEKKRKEKQVSKIPSGMADGFKSDGKKRPD